MSCVLLNADTQIISLLSWTFLDNSLLEMGSLVTCCRTRCCVTMIPNSNNNCQGMARGEETLSTDVVDDRSTAPGQTTFDFFLEMPGAVTCCRCCRQTLSTNGHTQWQKKTRKPVMLSRMLSPVVFSSVTLCVPSSGSLQSCPGQNTGRKKETCFDQVVIEGVLTMQRLTFPFPFVHHQSHVYQQPRPSGTTINRGNEDWPWLRINNEIMCAEGRMKGDPLLYARMCVQVFEVYE